MTSGWTVLALTWTQGCASGVQGVAFCTLPAALEVTSHFPWQSPWGWNGPELLGPSERDFSRRPFSAWSVAALMERWLPGIRKTTSSNRLPPETQAEGQGSRGTNDAVISNVRVDG